MREIDYDSDDKQEFYAFSTALIGSRVVTIKRGYGSALILEFSNDPGVSVADAYVMSIMIEWSWRIEGRKSILCGSWSDEQKWRRPFALLRKSTVMDVTLFGRLSEIEIKMVNGLRILSFMTAGGDPAWTIFRKSHDAMGWMSFRRGKLHVESKSQP